MNKTALFLCASIFLFSFGAGLSAQDLPIRRIEDDSYIRLSLETSWLRESPDRVLARKPETYTLRGGGRVEVRVETSPQNRDEFAVVLARWQNGGFSSWNQGSWSLIRRRDNDPSGSRIQIFLRRDHNTYVQFRPFNNERCFMDVVLYDAYLVRSLPLPVEFERLYVMPVESVLALAGGSFPRRYFEPESGMYRDSRAFIGNVRARLPELDFRDDGAIDENGNYVFIETLKAQDASKPEGVNCSGFAKWIVDGILKPVTGARLPVAPLKERFGQRGSSLTEMWEESRDPFFGLDWCRNLASRAGKTLGAGDLEEIEVRVWPFSLLRNERAAGKKTAPPAPYTGFLNEAGFGVEGLLPLLYTLAVDEPNRIYLAAVNDEKGAPVTSGNPRGLPRLRQYYHIAVLVPYFNERGVFHTAVFESAAETSITRFIARYPGQFVNLSRVAVDGRFQGNAD